MKGYVVQCIQGMVTSQYGREMWQDILEHAGMQRDTYLMPSFVVQDEKVHGLIDAMIEKLEMDRETLMDALGEYWVKEHTQKKFGGFYDMHRNGRDFLLNVNSTHRSIVSSKMQTSQPPDFTFNWEDDQTLMVQYQSKRDMIDFMMGIVKALMKYYDNEVSVEKMDETHVRIMFHEVALGKPVQDVNDDLLNAAG